MLKGCASKSRVIKIWVTNLFYLPLKNLFCRIKYHTELWFSTHPIDIFPLSIRGPRTWNSTLSLLCLSVFERAGGSLLYPRPCLPERMRAADQFEPSWSACNIFGICGILMPVFFMSFIDQFGDGISIAVGFIVIRVREHLHLYFFLYGIVLDFLYGENI